MGKTSEQGKCDVGEIFDISVGLRQRCCDIVTIHCIQHADGCMTEMRGSVGGLSARLRLNRGKVILDGKQFSYDTLLLP